jgi:hypothetical protein
MEMFTLARGRVFKWQSANGNLINLTDRAGSGYWVLNGVKGLGKPIYDKDQEDKTGSPGWLLRGVRAAARQIFLPIEVSGSTRAEFLARKQGLNAALDPELGLGYLLITDAGVTYRIAAIYDDGFEGDETVGVAGEEGAASWDRSGLTFAADMFFEGMTPVSFTYGYQNTAPFFPIFPIKLNPSQLLSDASQAVVNNYVLNPRPETGVANWSGLFFSEPAVVYSRVTVPAPPAAVGGSWVFQAIWSAPPGGGSATANGAFFASPSGSLISGRQYTASGYVYVPSGNPRVRLQTWDGNSPFNTKFDEWELLTVTFTASFSLNKLVLVRQEETANAGGGVAYVDAVMLNDGPPTTYIDGSRPNCHWAGTAYASASYRDATYSPTTISNPGTKSSPPTFYVAGPTTNVDLVKRGTPDQHVTLNYTIVSGQVVTFDMGAKTCLLNDGTNLYIYLTADDWWELDPGDNSVSMSALGAATGTSIAGTFDLLYESIV